MWNAARLLGLAVAWCFSIVLSAHCQNLEPASPPDIAGGTRLIIYKPFYYEGFPASANTIKEPERGARFGSYYTNLEDIKALYPHAVTWEEHDHHARKVVFCIDAFDKDAANKGLDILGFHYVEEYGWTKYFHASTQDIGLLCLIFDEEKGVCNIIDKSDGKVITSAKLDFEYADPRDFGESSWPTFRKTTFEELFLRNDAPRRDVAYCTALKNIEEVKALCPQAQKWSEHKYQDRTFLFCIDSLGIHFSVIPVDVIGWYYAEGKGWSEFFRMSSKDLGGVRLVYDDRKGVCMIIGAVNNQLKDKIIASVNLAPDSQAGR